MEALDATASDPVQGARQGCSVGVSGRELSRRRGAAALPSLVPRGAATAAAGTRWRRTGNWWNGNAAGVDWSRLHRSPGVRIPPCKRPAGDGEEESTASDPTAPWHLPSRLPWPRAPGSASSRVAPSRSRDPDRGNSFPLTSSSKMQKISDFDRVPEFSSQYQCAGDEQAATPVPA
ncbi:hypothetical protein STEG23_010578, partial [Scotinomys teguina]